MPNRSDTNTPPQGLLADLLADLDDYEVAAILAVARIMTAQSPPSATTATTAAPAAQPLS